MINLMEITDFRDNLCTRQKASRPALEEGKPPLAPVTNSLIVAIDFDDATANYAKKFHLTTDKNSKDVTKSSDALYQHNKENVHFVEFKSSKPEGRKETLPLKLKATESLLTFMDLTKTCRDYARKNMIFILVFHESSEDTRTELRKKKRKNVGQPAIISCGLRRLKGMYFKDVLTLTSSEFEEYITKEGWTSMCS